LTNILLNVIYSLHIYCLKGGTVDITVHEISSDGSLREIYKASGGDWGGNKVNQAFENFLIEITGIII
jgi:hypothetical protein